MGTFGEENIVRKDGNSSDFGTFRYNVSRGIELSQKVDRGESIVDGPFQNIEDFIDPKTLTPYEILDDEEEEDYHYFDNNNTTTGLTGSSDLLDGGNVSIENDEKAIERELSMLATQNHLP